ncbi:hypothetical protein F1654_06520 [Alkalicaulis satelles]|uniref:Putative Flp pilus-assembly TadG-like N-terminal domain-containing protein n=1 Tax=Alkalicaulis satelles TaxID=2609175 RepID=A0A5M6ZFD4_9PROT|nr:pilus assembly protein TadG-related protein [Alkalicaulis satelles]KAA5803456.1 hypothetical protein F1654_06520 [Alkalicaulis satelles]
MFGRAVQFLFNALRDRRGQAAVITAVCAPVIVGGGGLGAETALWFYQQRAAQMAADLSAYAGAVEKRAGRDDGAVRASVTEEARRHGYRADRGPIAVNMPPLSGPNRTPRAVEVIIEQSWPRLFSGLFLKDDVRFEVRAVARFEDARPACLLALDTAGSQAMRFSGSSETRLTQCDLMANSIAPDALTVSGSGQVLATCANTVGGYSATPGLVLTDCPEPRTHLPPALDPFDHLDIPVASGCRNIPGGSGTRTIQPGRYCNGMTMNGSIQMEPGVYIVDGGTFRINGSANVIGHGVTIVLTNNAEVQMNGNADIHLSAPTSGPYAGLVLWGDRNNAPDTSARLNGTASSGLIGALYFPSQTVDMLGNFSGSQGCTRIVAWRMDLSGNANFESDCSHGGVQTIQTPGAVRLVE